MKHCIDYILLSSQSIGVFHVLLPPLGPNDRARASAKVGISKRPCCTVV